MLVFSHDLVLDMEMVDEGIRIVGGETYVNSNGRVVIEFKGNNAGNNTEKKKRNMHYMHVNSNGRVVIELKGNNTENNTEKKRNMHYMQLIDMAYINDKGEQVVIEDRCGEEKLCCIQRVGEDAEVEQSLVKHRVKAIAQEIIYEIISIAEKRVKSAPDEMQDESMEVEKSVGGGRKINKKKINKNDKNKY